MVSFLFHEELGVEYPGLTLSVTVLTFKAPSSKSSFLTECQKAIDKSQTEGINLHEVHDAVHINLEQPVELLCASYTLFRNNKSFFLVLYSCDFG